MPLRSTSLVWLSGFLRHTGCNRALANAPPIKGDGASVLQEQGLHMAFVNRSQTSPDGALTLEIDSAEDLIGFHGEAWHTHGDLLVPEYGSTPEEARNAFFDLILADKVVICVWSERASPHRVSVTLDLEEELRAAGGEALILRLWSGKAVAA